MSKDYNRQHIVPQAYLKRFAMCRGDNYQIGISLKPTASRCLKLFTNSVESVAYIEKYYDTQVRKNPKYWEHYLDKNFDTLCGSPLLNIIAKITMAPDNIEVLSEQDKDVLARIIISQAIRVPQFLDEQTDLAQERLLKYKKAILNSLPASCGRENDLISKMTFSRDERKDMVLTASFNAEKFSRFCEVIKKKYWFIFYNDIRDRMPYITSDNPVVFTTIKAKTEKMTTIGLLNDETVILYPISPSILIGIYSPLLYFGELSKYNGHRMHISDMKFITNVNILITEQSCVHTFLPEPLFSILRERI